MKIKSSFLAAGVVLAIAFIFSCSSDDSDGGGISSPSVGDGESSSSEGTQGSVSSSSSNGGESEVKITKSKITGVSQKGPFVEGSTATLYELNDEFAQTGRSFRDIIADNKGSFEIKGVELISPYAMLEASGYYRNEVTGEVSKGPIALFAIADIREKDNVNVNLLTHLEYYRVLNLVEGGKSVAEAKKQAQKEILAVFGINGDFENSEDMTIFGTTDGDAALLAISIMLPGDLGEGEFSQRLTNFAQSVKGSGKWENEAVKAAIADWVLNANLSGIRSNITGWGLSSEVPDFEKYVTAYWATAYGLGGCGSTNRGEVKKDNRNVYRICKNSNWAVASELEYDTYQWSCSAANEGEIKAGDVSGEDYVCENKAWRTATSVETDIQSVCLASNEGEIKAGKTTGTDYICKNKEWSVATEFERDTYQWVCSASNEGEIKAGNVSGKDYICKNKGWVLATEFERDTYQWSCSASNEGEIKTGNVSEKDYICKNKGWMLATEFERDTYQWVCSATNEEEIKVGKATGTDYICKNKEWIVATEFERDTYKWSSCSDSNIGEIKKGNVSNKKYICKYGIWQEPNSYKDKYCVENSCKYFVDSRDNQQYTYVTIGGQTWMAENLNYNAEGSKCNGNRSTNCDKYGRLYDWETALTACPNDWHLPTEEEWVVMMTYIGYRDAGNKLRSTSGWNYDYYYTGAYGTDDYGFSGLPGGYGLSDGSFGDVGSNLIWWGASDDTIDGFEGAYYWDISFDSTDLHYWITDKSYLYSVRCLKD